MFGKPSLVALVVITSVLASSSVYGEVLPNTLYESDAQKVAEWIELSTDSSEFLVCIREDGSEMQYIIQWDYIYINDDETDQRIFTSCIAVGMTETESSWSSDVIYILFRDAVVHVRSAEVRDFCYGLFYRTEEECSAFLDNSTARFQLPALAL